MTTPIVSGPQLIEKDDGLVRWLIINRTDVFNALNASVFEDLSGAIDRLSDSRVRCLVITGAGERAFSAGADLDELHELAYLDAEAVLARGGDVLNRLERLRIPVIAAVNGFALGGGFELAMACTLILASDNAVFGLPETSLGLMPGYGGTQRLQAQIGPQAARHMVLSGSRIDAATAHQLGLLADRPSSPETFLKDVQVIAEEIGRKGPLATAMALQALHAFSEIDRQRGFKLERTLAARCIASDEGREGMAAFHEKRPPSFATRQ